MADDRLVEAETACDSDDLSVVYLGPDKWREACRWLIAELRQARSQKDVAVLLGYGAGQAKMRERAAGVAASMTCDSNSWRDRELGDEIAAAIEELPDE